MLQNLHIQNYALIEKLDIEFQRGFSVITGETGAGKSIILGALSILLGGRAEVKSIKTGANRCVIEGNFHLDGYNLKEFFEENDLDYENECLIRREMLSSGKSRAFVNDTPVSINVLRELGKQLIDIHSQHRNLLINEESFQINILDLLASNEKERSVYNNYYSRYAEIARQIADLKQTMEQNVADQDYISFQLQQLDEAKLQPNEQGELEEELEVLSHAEEIKQGLFQADEILQTDGVGILQKLRECRHQLQAISGVYPKAEALVDRLESTYIEIKDIAGEIESELEDVNFDPLRQAYLDDRLNTIYSLQKKHRVGSLDELITIADGFREKLSAIDNGEERIKELEKEENVVKSALQEAADELTESRMKSAVVIEKEMVERLILLGMPNIDFKVDIQSRTKPDSTGNDKVCFMFSANKNSPLQNVSQVASGGEIARVMLSLKALISKSENLPTIIFDEIDTGVSGSIAERMAITMYEMSRGKCQVISITHLPQIAALGEHHYKVYKEDTATDTNTNITELNEEQRISEIANMLSGSTLTEAAISNAKELLKQQS